MLLHFNLLFFLRLWGLSLEPVIVKSSAQPQSDDSALDLLLAGRWCWLSRMSREVSLGFRFLEETLQCCSHLFLKNLVGTVSPSGCRPGRPGTWDSGASASWVLGWQVAPPCLPQQAIYWQNCFNRYGPIGSICFRGKFSYSSCQHST
jgi:hypothetical protein